MRNPQSVNVSMQEPVYGLDADGNIDQAQIDREQKEQEEGRLAGEAKRESELEEYRQQRAKEDVEKTLMTTMNFCRMAERQYLSPKLFLGE